jgi:hypothetical protein
LIKVKKAIGIGIEYNVFKLKSIRDYTTLLVSKVYFSVLKLCLNSFIAIRNKSSHSRQILEAKGYKTAVISKLAVIKK